MKKENKELEKIWEALIELQNDINRLKNKRR